MLSCGEEHHLAEATAWSFDAARSVLRAPARKLRGPSGIFRVTVTASPLSFSTKIGPMPPCAPMAHQTVTRRVEGSFYGWFRRLAWPHSHVLAICKPMEVEVSLIRPVSVYLYDHQRVFHPLICEVIVIIVIIYFLYISYFKQEHIWDWCNCTANTRLWSSTSPAQLTKTTTDSSATPLDPTRHRSKRKVPAAAASQHHITTTGSVGILSYWHTCQGTTWRRLSVFRGLQDRLARWPLPASYKHAASAFYLKSVV